MSPRVITRDRHGVLTTGESPGFCDPGGSPVSRLRDFRPLIGGMPEFIETEAAALQRARLLANRHFPPVG